jgi:ribonucleoside-diphosphate reductase alpha chain
VAKSITDYIFRWLEARYLHDRVSDGEIGEEFTDFEVAQNTAAESKVFIEQSDAPPCSECGSIMVRNGACYKCLNCGGTSGCS